MTNSKNPLLHFADSGVIHLYALLPSFFKDGEACLKTVEGIDRILLRLST